jgi:ubiquinone/menaquinone biosynthesis C-methylase UbiE
MLRAPVNDAPASMTHAERIKDINVRYHDAAADGYDRKWGIDYGATGRRQVKMKLAKALGEQPRFYRSALEVGAGTGYFSLNLLRAGVIGEATATDISPGMVRRLAATADDLGLALDSVAADAERLPFADETFELVLGHAVLHHIPNLGAALEEFHRVLTPGGTIAFMGEPSRRGDMLAALPKRIGLFARPAWKWALRLEERTNGASPTPAEPAGTERSSEEDDRASAHSLEPWVDVHVFTPKQLAGMTKRAGFVDVRVTGEELLASTCGWLFRTLQADSDPERIPRGWHLFAFASYVALQWVDGRLLEPRLPPGLFYNLLLSARKPS